MSRSQEGSIGAGRKKREEAMYSQAELVLKKKAEIEAKMAANKNDKCAKVGSIQNRKPITMSIKSRWGLKGKKVLPSGAVPPATTTSITENDNSWEKYTTPLQSTIGPPQNIQEHSITVNSDVNGRHSSPTHYDPPPTHYDPPQMILQPTLPPAVQPQELPPSYLSSVSEPQLDVRFAPNLATMGSRMPLPAPTFMSQPPPAPPNPAPPNPLNHAPQSPLNPAPPIDTSRPPPRYPPPPQATHAAYNHTGPPPPVLSQETSLHIHAIPPQVVSYTHPAPPQPTLALQSAPLPTPQIQTAPHMTVGLAPNITTSLASIVSTVPHQQIQMQTTNPMHIPSISHMQSVPASHLQSTHTSNLHNNHIAPQMSTNPPAPHMPTNSPAPHMHNNPPPMSMAPISHMQSVPQMGSVSHMQSTSQIAPVSHVKPATQMAPVSHMQPAPQMAPVSHMQTIPHMSLPAIAPESHLQPVYHVSAGPPHIQAISSSHMPMTTGPPPQAAPPMPIAPVHSELPVHSAPPPHHITSVPPPHMVPSQLPNPRTPMTMNQAPPPLLLTHSAPPTMLTNRPPPFHQPLLVLHPTQSTVAQSLTAVPPPGGGKPAWWTDTISKAKEMATSMGRPNSPPPGPLHHTMPSGIPPVKSVPATGTQNASGWGEYGDQQVSQESWQKNNARNYSNEDKYRGGDNRRHDEEDRFGREVRQKGKRFSDDREDRYSPRTARDRSYAGENRYRKQSEEDHAFRSKEDGRRFRDTDLRKSKDEEDEKFRSSRERRDSRENIGYKRSEQKRYSEDNSKGPKANNYEDGERFDAYGGGEEKIASKTNQRQEKDLREMLDSRIGEDLERRDVRSGSKGLQVKVNFKDDLVQGGNYEGGKCLDIDLRKSSRETEVYSPTRPTYTPTKKSEGESLPTVVEELASMVAISGEDLEEVARGRNQTTPELKFLFEKNSSLYNRYRERVTELKKTLEETDNRKRVASQSTAEPPKKRRSRWGSQETSSSIPPPGVANVGQPGMVVPSALGAPGVSIPTQLGAPGLAIPTQLGAPVGVIPPTALMPRFNVQPNTKLSEIQRSNPGLVSYAIKVFGTTDLSDAQWKQCEDQLKMSVVYGQLAAKQATANAMGGKGRNKYEYDSDEDTAEGTWEHRQRRQEMQKTQPVADKVNAGGEGAHHIGDYLPPEELTKFMNKYKALRNGDKWDSSEYQENKLQSDNKGFKMLQKMGWSEGAGLGSSGMGITAPIGKSGMSGERMGLGVEKPGEISANDDEFDSYRKRMMMAYRFRPNPLNNPRRAYY